MTPSFEAPAISSLRIVIPGEPIPQNTGKVGRWKSKDGREGTTIRQPSKVIKYKLEVEERAYRAAAATGLLKVGQPFFGQRPVVLSVCAVFALPVSRHRKRSPLPRTPHTGRYGNLDNLLKAIQDACEVVLWADDGQICCLRNVEKWWGAQGESPFVEIEVSEYSPAAGLGLAEG